MQYQDSHYIELTCSICGKFFKKSVGEYNRRVKLHKTEFACSKSCGVSLGNRLYPRFNNPGNLDSANRRDEFTPFRWFMGRIRYRTCRKGESDIDERYLKNIWDQQQGICPITGILLTLPNSTTGFISGKLPYNASLDRINNNLGYMRGNVRFIALIANFARGIWDDIVLLDFCKRVIDKNI